MLCRGVGSGRWARWLLGSLALALLASLPVSGRAATTSFGTGQLGVLSGVSALSADNAWAVGEGTDASTGAHTTLVLHWNGTSWGQMASPNPGGTTKSRDSSTLDSVSAISASNVWAVGSYTNPSTRAHESLVLHWSGGAWSQVASPNPGGTTSSGSGTNLESVSAISANDIWAAGGYLNRKTGADETLVIHWRGSSWIQDSSPSPGGTKKNDLSDLDAVKAVSSGDAWAVGEYSTAAKSSGRDSLVLHWNGAKWGRVPSPNSSGAAGQRVTNLSGVTALSARFALAVGAFSPEPSTNALESLALRWSGSRWSQLASPNPGGITSVDDFTNLSSVSALSASNAWAVGDDSDASTGSLDTVVLHWNGSRWSEVTSPNPSTTASYLFDVDAVSTKDVWAVGSYYDGTTKSDYTLVLHWDGVTWLPA